MAQKENSAPLIKRRHAVTQTVQRQTKGVKSPRKNTRSAEISSTQALNKREKQPVSSELAPRYLRTAFVLFIIWASSTALILKPGAFEGEFNFWTLFLPIVSIWVLGTYCFQIIASKTIDPYFKRLNLSLVGAFFKLILFLISLITSVVAFIGVYFTPIVILANLALYFKYRRR